MSQVLQAHWMITSCRAVKIRDDVPFRYHTVYPPSSHLPNVWPVLDQRRRRWANTGQTLGRCVVFSGIAPRIWWRIRMRSIRQSKRGQATDQGHQSDIVALVLKGRICPSTKSQIRPFNTKVTKCTEVLSFSQKCHLDETTAGRVITNICTSSETSGHYSYVNCCRFSTIRCHGGLVGERLAMLIQNSTIYQIRNLRIHHVHDNGALVWWLKLPAWKIRDRGFEPHSAIHVSKKKKVSSPLNPKDSILWGASVTER